MQAADKVLMPSMEARAARIHAALNGMGNFSARDNAGRPTQRVRPGTAEWQSASLLRLEPGDPGYVLWTRTRTRVLEEFAALARAWSRVDPEGRTVDELVTMPRVGPF